MRLLNKSDKKDRFIESNFYQYMISSIKNNQSSNEIIKKFASLNIFPIKFGNQIYLSSLDDGYVWFYDKNNKSKDSKYYRIIDLQAFGKQQDEFITIFHSNSNLVKKYDDKQAIEVLINEMSKEIDLSRDWWNAFKDMIEIWNENINVSDPSRATKCIHKHYFLFDEFNNYSLKATLLKHHILEDVTNLSYYNKIKTNLDESKMKKLLKYLGIPNQLVFKSHNNDKIKTPLDEFYKDFNSLLDLNKSKTNSDIFIYLTEKLGEDLINAFIKEYCDNIVVKNRKGQYSFLKDLTYYTDKDVSTDYEFEKAHIDEGVFKNKKWFSNTSLLCIEHITENNFRQYIDCDMDLFRFVKWIFKYDNNVNMVQVACRIISDYLENRFLSLTETEFLLKRLSEFPTIETKNYNLRITIDSSLVENYCNVIKPLSVNNCHIQVSDAENYSSENVISQMFKIGKYKGVLQKILDEDLPQHCICFKGDENINILDYIQLNNEESAQNYLLLKSFGSNYDVSFMYLVDSLYKTNLKDDIQINSIGDINRNPIDWKEEYKKLLDGIRNFYSQESSGISFSSYRNINLADIYEFNDEKELIEKLISTSLNTDNNQFVYDFLSRDALGERYKGQCQLCGTSIPSDRMNGHYYEFRIVEPHENPLNDIDGNLLCLCPSCWGELKHGFKRLNLTSIKEKSKRYIDDLFDSVEREDEENQPVISNYANLDKGLKPLRNYKDLINPIVCRVTVNGVQRDMIFSWRHFIIISYILNVEGNAEYYGRFKV